MHLCKVCQQSFEHTRTFKLHLKRIHNTTLKDYTIKYDFMGRHPTCACGCNELVSWCQDSYFKNLIIGHHTLAQREAQSKRRKGKTTSNETKEKLSKVLKKLYQTKEGSLVNQERSKNLHKFHSSEKGKILSLKRSSDMKLFNKSEKGKEIRFIAGKKVSNFRKENPEKMYEMGTKLKTFWKTDEGKQKSKIRSEKLSNFYKSEKGKLVLEKMKDKITIKNRLSREKFNEKFKNVHDEFEFLDKIPSYEEYIGYRETFTITVSIRCKKHHHIQRRLLINIINVPKCLICNGTFSKPQHDVSEFVSSLNVEVEVNNKKLIAPLEIDILIPEKNFGIEFNGLYWHSECNRSDNIHVDFKHSIAREKGIKLFTIFEDEWRDKRNLVENMIKHRLGLSSRLFARKLQIRELSSQERKTFFNLSHLDGDTSSIISFGLVKDDIIYSAISLRKPFHKSLNDKLEIARFAHLIGHTVVGGHSRLLKCVEKWAISNGYKSLLSYVDTRVGDGSSYIKSGFLFIRHTGPRFWWTDFVNRYDRFKFRAQGDKKQKQVAKENKVHKIFGSGNFVFEKQLEH